MEPGKSRIERARQRARRVVGLGEFSGDAFAATMRSELFDIVAELFYDASGQEAASFVAGAWNPDAESLGIGAREVRFYIRYGDEVDAPVNADRTLTHWYSALIRATEIKFFPGVTESGAAEYIDEELAGEPKDSNPRLGSWIKANWPMLLDDFANGIPLSGTTILYVDEYIRREGPGNPLSHDAGLFLRFASRQKKVGIVLADLGFDAFARPGTPADRSPPGRIAAALRMTMRKFRAFVLSPVDVDRPVFCIFSKTRGAIGEEIERVVDECATQRGRDFRLYARRVDEGFQKFQKSSRASDA